MFNVCMSSMYRGCVFLCMSYGWAVAVGNEGVFNVGWCSRYRGCVFRCFSYELETALKLRFIKGLLK